MRIGVYNPRVGIAESGGTETFLREMLKRISPDHDVVLYTGAGDLHGEVTALDIEIEQYSTWLKEGRKNRIVSGKTPIIPAELESLSMYHSVRQTGGFAAMEEDVDVVSTHYYLDNILVSRTASVPTLFRYPGIKSPSIRWRLMARTASPDVYLANSRSTSKRSRNWLDIEPDGTVYAGVDVDQFSPDAEPAFESDVPVVLYVGRLDDGKGLSDLLEAFARLDTGAELHLVGEGTLESSLRATARELDIDDSVVFRGAVPHGKIHQYYAAADVFCLPSYHESLGLVNLEAMATGVPVISTQIDAVTEYLVDGENGLLIRPGNVGELASAMERLLDDPSERERIGRNAREKCKEGFSWEVQATRMIDYYAEAIDEP